MKYESVFKLLESNCKLDLSISNSEIHVDVVRLDCEVNGRNGGGVCVYLHCYRNFRIREDLTNKDLELLIIEIVNPRCKQGRF